MVTGRADDGVWVGRCGRRSAVGGSCDAIGPYLRSSDGRVGRRMQENVSVYLVMLEQAIKASRMQI